MKDPTKSSDRLSAESRQRLKAGRTERTGRFERNCDQLRQDGYNLKVGKAVVFVDGHPVHRGRFEELATVRLQALIADKIGMPRREADRGREVSHV